MTCCERTLVTLACAAGLCQREGDGAVDDPRRVLETHLAAPILYRLCEPCRESCERVLAILEVVGLLADGNKAIAREYVATYRRAYG